MQTMVGLDIGTTSISLVVLNTQNGDTLFTQNVAHESRLPDDLPGAYIQSPEKILSAALCLLRPALDRYGRRGTVKSIGVSGQMHGIVFVDTDGDAVSPVYTWLDMRAAHTGSDGISHVSALERLTGEKIPPGYGAATLYALARTGALPPAAAAFCTVTDYVAMHLAGASSPSMDPTLAHSLGLFNPESTDFQRDAWHRISAVPPPKVLPCTTVIGQFNRTIPVTAASGDNQAGFLASVRDTRCGIQISIGTSSQISFIDSKGAAPRAEPAAANTALDSRPFPTGQTLMVGAGITGGKSFDVLGGLIRDIAHRIGADSDFNPYSILDQFRTPPAGIDPPAVETTFRGTRLNPDRRGAVRGITLENFTIEPLFWGFAAGIVDELHRMIAPDSGPPAEIFKAPGLHITASGSAVKKNPALRRMIAERFGCPLMFPRHQESAARGAALIGFAGRCGDAALLPELVSRTTDYVSG